MATSAKVLAIKTLARRCLLGALAVVGLLAGGAVSAQQAQPADRCEGTLCDLYYGSRGSTPAAPKAAAPIATAPGVPPGATPLTAPSGGSVLGWFGGGPSTTPRPAPPPSAEAASTNSYMHLGAGGLLGDRNERCTGTLCDTFYGSSPAEPAAGQQAAATIAPTTGRESVVPHRHIVHESETRPKCSSPTADPWHCMR